MNAQNTLLFFIIITITCEEDVRVKIGLPEYICDKNGKIKDINKNLTTIRLLGQDSQDTIYKFDVKYQTIGKKCSNQRCTLLMWKAVRNLDRYLTNYSAAKLQSGLMEINNTLLNPGLNYIINVKLMKNGALLKEKQLTLEYLDSLAKEKVKKPMASLLLLAPDYSYAYSNYVINVEANICSNLSSYYFTWELVNSDQNSTKFSSRSSELTISSDTLQALQVYKIKCVLISQEEATVAEGQQSLNVLSKGLQLQLPIKHLTARTGQEIKIKTYVRDLDNIDGDFKFSWSCFKLSTNEICEYGSETNELEMNSFEPGLYNLSLEVSKSKFSESDFCTVQVSDNSPTIEIEDFDYPLSPTKEIKISVIIYQLRTFCSLQWTSPMDEDYTFIDLSLVPGNVDRIINVTTKEDLFLNELEEFTNDTIDSRHDLLIPAPSDNWEGLQGDAKYLFRLLINCPELDEVLSEFNGSEIFTTDVVIKTNAPPEIHELKVTPLKGVAFVTTFIFETLKAEDKDEPVLYKFGIILENETVILWNLQEVINCESVLPYSENGIQTFLEVCDSFGACTKTLGPLIVTTPPEKNQKKIMLQKFAIKMLGENYDKAFNDAFIILRSFKDEEINEFINEKILQEIEKFIKSENKNIRERANILLTKINEFNTKLQLPETVINKVVDLRNKISTGAEAYTKRKLLSLRMKRASSLTLHDVKNYLEISELIITTSNDPNKIALEKENLRKQLENYMEKLCSNMKKNQLILELKTMIFSVEKLKKNALNNFISVPFEGNSWQIFARVKLGNVVKDSKEKCIGKAMFKDYLTKSGIVYFIDILNSADINEAAEITIFLPKNKTAEGNPKCVVYANGNWQKDCKVMQNIANFVKCSCKRLGYYHLEYTQDVTTTTTINNKVITTTSSSITDKISVHNDSLKIIEGSNKENYDTISYIVIVVSVIGVIILAIALRKIFQEDDEDEESDTFEFPKYAQLHNEEFLTDAHI